ncbi:MAG: preprotein translocase subunit SecB [Gammaproteobacteria bacterium]|nr:preprotein translocase subunit SecB [Gammaproteobacteria bacterium]
MISADLQKAIDNLNIQDVYVRDQIASCSAEFDPKYDPDIERLNVQQMHLVKQANVIEFDDQNRLLRVFVRLGARWVDQSEKSEELSVKALIEAEFTAEYEMTELLEEASIDEFCLKNVSYHVWPYWRELLSNQCARMHLPRLVLPTVQFAQNRHQRLEDVECGEDTLQK